ncbi:MAG: 2-C-methyl-D-erythritol 4-phosphate cytidylyltransferase [Tannerellaceae bacterium]
MKRYVLIVAGGKGLRMGSDLPKQFIPIEGKPILMHTLEAFHRWDAEAKLILVLPTEHQDYWRMLCKELGCSTPHTLANGGETRFHSVQNGLQQIEQPGLVAVHDGVRPFVTSEVITACFEAAERQGAAVPAIPLTDSLRYIEAEGSHPVDRSRYLAVQTPQVFCSDLLLRAYRQSYSPLFTDDASVVEAIGQPVTLVPGNPENIKITTPFDLKVAEILFSYYA